MLRLLLRMSFHYLYIAFNRSEKGHTMFIYIYIYIYIHLIEGKILYFIERKNNQHFNNISATAFINSCQHLQFIYSAQNHLNPKDHYRYQETRYYLQ